ncbi:MAG: allophanate hydrolase-related protein [Halioglobus sp.]
MGIGKVKLADGSERPGFICEPWGLAGALEISGMGGWRGYIARRQTS